MNKKTKVVCTIGPSSWDPKVMKEMIEHGMNCARVNGAFADPEELDKVKHLVKSVANDVSLMVDVKGPEVRLNKFGDPKEIKTGDIIKIGNDENAEIYPSNYNNLYTYLAPGQRMVIGDGDVEMKLNEIQGDKMICEVVFGEILKPGKALNLPGADYSTEVLTEKDKINLKHGMETGWDFVSASFIQNAESAKMVKDFIAGSNMQLIAKIEDKEGVENIEEVLEIVDGIMIARGGLGVELGLEHVPSVQRYLTLMANDAGKPVITATQMLESMTYNSRPTRAEVNDVATAIMLGSDAVMLSGESSAGDYPIEAVKELTKVAGAVEPDLEPYIVPEISLGNQTTDALTKAAAKLCMEDESIQKVIVVSRTGRTAKLIGRNMIEQPIYAFVSSDEYVRHLSLAKGVNKAFVLEDRIQNRDTAINKILEVAKGNGVVESGDKILLVSKIPYDVEEDFFPNLFEVMEV